MVQDAIQKYDGRVLNIIADTFLLTFNDGDKMFKATHEIFMKWDKYLDKMKIEVRAKLDKIEKLGDLEYDEDCDYCMKNPFTLDAIETKKKLEYDKDEVKDYLTKLDTVILLRKTSFKFWGFLERFNKIFLHRFACV